MLNLKSSVGALWAAATLPALPLTAEASNAGPGGRGLEGHRATAAHTEDISVAAYTDLAEIARDKGLDITKPLQANERQLCDDLIASHLPLLVKGGVVSEGEAAQLRRVLSGESLPPHELKELIHTVVKTADTKFLDGATEVAGTFLESTEIFKQAGQSLAAALVATALAAAALAAASRHPTWAKPAWGAAVTLAGLCAAVGLYKGHDALGLSREGATAATELVGWYRDSQAVVKQAQRMALFTAGKEAHTRFFSTEEFNLILESIGRAPESE